MRRPVLGREDGIAGRRRVAATGAGGYAKAVSDDARQRLCAAALALGVGSGCVATPPAPASEPEAPTIERPALEPRSADRPAKTLDEDRARAEAEKIMAEVARARNLEVTSGVEVTVIDRAGVREFAKSNLHEQLSPEEIAREGRILASLGVIPLGTDLEQVVLDLLETGILGFYDPKKKTLFIGDYVPITMLSNVVGHEIAHGLQDMHFGLERLQEPMRHESDAESARRYLVEGDAQAAYYAWVSGDQGLEAIDDDVLDALGNQVLDLAGVSPYPILARDLQLPYADGAATVARLAREKGWKAVDALYDDLPQTSEQMLHVDKLLKREPAIPVELDTAALLDVLPDHEVVWHDTLGEASLLAMLAHVEPSLVARRAASGWGGDHFVVLDKRGSRGEAPVVVCAVVWDSKRDATEFEATFRAYLAEQIGEAHVIERRRDRVVFATMLPEGVAGEAVAAAAWKTLRTGRKAKGGKSK